MSSDQDRVPGDSRRLRVWGEPRPVVVFLLLVVSLLAWREGIYYSGGLDGVVVAKAAVGVAALALAWLAAPSGALNRLRARTLLIVTAYLVVAMIGALSSGNVVASAVLSVRVMLVFLTVAFLVVTYSPAVLVRSMSSSMCAIGAVLAASGISSFVPGGRLSGVLLPTNPNQLALLFGPPLLCLIWRVTQPRPRLWHLTLLVGLVGLTWLTGSRAGLFGLAVGIVILVVLAPRMNVGIFSALLASVPVVLFVVGYTALLANYFERGGTQNVTTLNSRTIAWQAAFSEGRDFFSQWFGAGLAVKTVSVTGTYWNSQVLDSSWVSSFVQAGVLGVGLLVLWATTTTWCTARNRSSYRGLWLAMAVYALLRSALENGLLDTYVLFVVMLLPSLEVDLHSSDPPRDPVLGEAPSRAGDAAARAGTAADSLHRSG